MINGGWTDFGEDWVRDAVVTELNSGTGPVIALFEDVPTDTAGTELSGDNYSRFACPVEASGNATITNNGELTGPTPSGTWPKVIGYKVLDDGGNAFFHGELINTPQQFTEANINTGTNTITITGHGLADNTRVVVRNEGGALPAGLSGAVGTEYYIITSASDTFQLSATEGGAAVDITDTGSGIHRIFKSYYQTPNPTAVFKIPDNGLTFTID